MQTAAGNDTDIFAHLPLFAEGEDRFCGFPDREELELMCARGTLVDHAEALQKECRHLDEENRFLNWESRSSLSFFSRAAKLAHHLNASDQETIIDAGVNEVAGFFKCGFAAFFIYNADDARFGFARSSRDAGIAAAFAAHRDFLEKLFISRPEAYIVDYNPDIRCLVFEDGEAFECDLPDKWEETVDERALVFPLRVKRPDSLEPHLLGGLILGDAGGALEGRDAEAAQFFADLLSASLHNAQLVEKLNTLTIVDPLTNIYNRRHLLSQLNTAMILARRQGHDLCIAMLDIDCFKRFNDEYGHIYGDEVLREVGRILKNGIRTGIDVAARYGGEEFVIVMPFTGMASAVDVSERLRRVIRDRRVKCENLELSVTCSFGVAQHVEGETLEQFIDRADTALYQAKNAGRDQVVAATGY